MLKLDKTFLVSNKKVLLIAKDLYTRYLIFFIFDNTTSHLIYIKYILYIYNINRKPDDK